MTTLNTTKIKGVLWAHDTQADKLAAILDHGNDCDVEPTIQELDSYVGLLMEYRKPNGAQDLAVAEVIGQYVADSKSFVGGFARVGGNLKFVNFHRRLIALQLILRVVAPKYIQQNQHQVCGPVTFMQGVVQTSPLGYVRYVIGLATTRRGSISVSQTVGQSLDVHVRKGSSILNKTANHTDMPEADYVALASLRDSENILPYRASWLPRWAVGGTTNAELVAWMRSAGFQHVEDHSHLFNPLWSVGPGGKDRVRLNLQTAKQRLTSNPPYTVIMTGAKGGDLADLAIDGYTSGGDNFMKVFGAHIMLLRGLDVDDTQGVSFDIVTWGQETDPDNLKRIPWDAVRKVYRGFVCGQP